MHIHGEKYTANYSGLLKIILCLPEVAFSKLEFWKYKVLFLLESHREVAPKQSDPVIYEVTVPIGWCV